MKRKFSQRDIPKDAVASNDNASRGSRKRARVDPGLFVPAPVPAQIPNNAQTDDPGYELFLGNIPDNITDLAIRQTVAEVLHTPVYVQYAGGVAFNFELVIKHKSRIGFLTLPFAMIGNRFLMNGGEIWLPGADYPIRVGQSKRPPDYNLVLRLRRTPYLTVASLQERDNRYKRLEERVPLSRASFGIWHSSNTFSVEFRTRGSDNPRSTYTTMSAWYDVDRRAIIIQRLGEPVADKWTARRAVPRSDVVVYVRNIHRIILDPKSLSMIFDLRFSATFEKDNPSNFDELCFGDNKRIRTRYIDNTHARVAPFIGSNLLLEFSQPQQFGLFGMNLRGVPHMAPIISDEQHSFKVIRGEIFALRWTHTLQERYKELPLQIALFCEQAVRSKAILPKDMLHCLDILEKAIEHSGLDVAALTLQNLISMGGVVSPFDARKNAKRSSIPELSGLEGQERSDALNQRLRFAGQIAVQELRFEKRWRNPDSALCHQVFATPSGFIFEPPQRDKSNRVLRKYPQHQQHFLRVTFTEEGGRGHPLRHPRQSPTSFKDFLQDTIAPMLRSGISFGGRKFEWVGYSSSALKEHQMLFLAPFTIEKEMLDGEVTQSLVTADLIRQEMGTFDVELMRRPAKYGARLGQAFSATDSSLEIPVEAVEFIGDIERNGWTFTDGAGDISLELATEIWASYQRKQGKKSDSQPPSAFQARFGGAKGVWSINPELKGMKIRVRKSQTKYMSDDRNFDIASTSLKPKNTFLNRPMIKLLEDLQVPYERLAALQHAAVEKVERAQNNFEETSRLLRQNGLGLAFHAPGILHNLSDMLGIDFDASPHEHTDFFRSISMLAITDALRDIKFRARIPIDGPTLIGICDTFGVLRPDEVYIRLKEDKKVQPALRGKVAITRSPVIHPGDIQFAQAVGDLPSWCPLSSLYNVLVFSAEGDRPMASMMGGGDLDGDLFNVLTDASIHPARTVPPGSYTAVNPHILDRPSTMDDVADFVVKFILGDQVGAISTSHLKIADQSPKGCFDPDCLLLAELHSQAVDFPKSGVPVEFHQLPKPLSRFKPDFLASSEDDPEDTYPSTKALGKLFRAVPIQKWELPDDSQKALVDASVLHKILEEVEHRYPSFGLKNTPSNDRLARRWRNVMADFCDQAQKIASRNCPARDDHLSLLEEELFLGTLSASQRLDKADKELIYRARAQVSEAVVTLRREIKDLKPGDEDYDSDEEDYIPPPSDPRSTLPAGSSRSLEPRAVPLKAKSERHPSPIVITVDDSDDEVVEISRPAASQSRERGPESAGPSSSIRGLDSSRRAAANHSHFNTAPREDEYDSDSSSVVEIARPDPRLMAIRNAHGAALFAFESLMGKTEGSDVPYGVRLFAIVALDILLTGIRLKTAPLMDANENTRGA